MTDARPLVCCNCRKLATHFEPVEMTDVYGHRRERNLYYCAKCRPTFAIPLPADGETPCTPSS